jgi:hypothetical protein
VLKCYFVCDIGLHVTLHPHPHTHIQVCNLPEDACGPLLNLPLYASLPPELQVRLLVHVMVL